MRNRMAAAIGAAVASVGVVALVLVQANRDDRTSAPPTTVRSIPTTTQVPETTFPVPYDPDTGVIGTIPPVDPNAGQGVLSSGGT